MGNRAGIPPWYVIKPTRSTQPCIPLGSLNRVPALIGWGKGGNVTSAGWQVTLCDPIWHVNSRSGAVLVAQTAIRILNIQHIIAVYCHEIYSVPSLHDARISFDHVLIQSSVHSSCIHNYWILLLSYCANVLMINWNFISSLSLMLPICSCFFHEEYR